MLLLISLILLLSSTIPSPYHIIYKQHNTKQHKIRQQQMYSQHQQHPIHSLTTFSIPSCNTHASINKLIVFHHGTHRVVQHAIDMGSVDDNMGKYQGCSRRDYQLELQIMEALTQHKHQQEHQHQDQDQDDVGLNNKSGLTKLANVMEAIVEHCDGKTKDIHKIMYLACKYLQLRLRYKLAEQALNEADRQSMLKAHVIDLLDKTSLLFIQQLQHPPVLGGHAQKQHRPAQTSRVLQASQRQKALLQSQSQPTKSLPKQNGFELSQSNKYAYLMEYIQEGGRNNIEKLLAELQQTVLTVHELFNSNQYKNHYDDVQQDNKNGSSASTCKQIQRICAILSNKLYRVIEILLTTIYTQKVSEENENEGQIDQQRNVSNRLPDFRSILVQEQQEQEGRSALLGPERCQTYNHLSIVLDYLAKILTLSSRSSDDQEKVLRDYCGFNVYLYAKMNLMYGSNRDNAMTSLIANIRVTAEKYVGELLGVQIGQDQQQEEVRLSPLHSYLLNLYSQSIDPSRQSNASTLMQSHNLIQQTLSLLSSHPLYCYLLTSLYFHLGLIDKQVYTFDEQYEANILRELLQAAASNRDTNNHDDDHDGRYNHENSGNQMRDEGIRRSRQLQRVGSLDYNEYDIMDHLDNRFDMPRESDLFQSGSSAKSPILHSPFIDTHPSLTPKILLRTICFYKSLHLSRLQTQHKFNLQLTSTQQQPKHIATTTANQLPLAQLIESLLSSTLPYEEVITMKQIEELRDLAKYSLGIGLQLEGYVMEYLRALVRKYAQTADSNGLDRYGLLLMQIEVNTAISASKKLFEGNPQLEANPHYSTEAFNIMYYDHFITQSTLNVDFNYVLLDVVREITGMRGEMWGINKNVAKEFESHFQVLFQLEKLTKRGRLVQSVQSNDEPIVTLNSQHRHSVPSSSPHHKQLTIILSRIDQITSILKRNDTQSCNEVLRVTEQILEDYYKIKQDVDKQVLAVQGQLPTLDKISDKLVSLIVALRNYVILMEHDGYVTQLLVKFRDMIF